MEVLETAIQVPKWLKEQSIRHFLIGGIALQYWGEPRLTRDVEVTVLVAPEDFEGFLDKAIKAFRPRIPNAIEFARKHRVLLLETESGIPIDISLGIPGYEEDAWAHSKEVEFQPFGKLRLISAEDLIIHKCIAGRPRDVEDVERVLVKQRLHVDVGRIRSLLRFFREIVEEHDPLELFESTLEQAQNLLKEGEGQ